MHIFYRKMQWGLLATVFLSLGGCLGGSVAQQLASSFAMHAADKMTASAIEDYESRSAEARRNIILQDSRPDPYWAAFVTSGFSQVRPIVEPVPSHEQPQTASRASIEATPLVRVEIWNLLIGEEKRAFLEKARLLGADNLPPKSEWSRWQVAAGALASDKNKPVVFLIPPGFGRVASGELALVEMSGAGELHYARYALN